MPATLTLTDDLASALEHAVEQGVPLETAAQAAGIGTRTLYEWISAGETGSWSTAVPLSEFASGVCSRFSQRIRQAQARFEAKQVQGVAEAAEAVGKNGIPEWRARAWLLNNHPRYRQRWREQREVIVDKTVTHVLEQQAVQAASLEQLEQWAALPEPDESR